MHTIYICSPIDSVLLNSHYAARLFLAFFEADIRRDLMSNNNYRSYRGKGPNGEDGIWYVEQLRGGPGGYPFERKHFVADNASPTTGDPRHNGSSRPWENYRHHTE